MRRAGLDLAMVLAVALAANFAYLLASNGDFYYPDSFTYLAPARNLLHGRGFLDSTGAIDTLRTPGYPLLLVLFGAATLPVIILQHLLNAALAAAIYMVMRRRGGTRLAALLASLLFAIDTPTIHYANKVLTETVFTLLLFAAFLLALARPRPVALGILSGMLVLVRPIAVAWFAVLAIFLVIRRVSLRQIAIFIVAALLLPVGWAARNATRTGVFTISSIGGINMLICRAAGALAMEDAGDFRSDLKDEQSGLIGDADDAIQRQFHVADAQELSSAVRARFYARFAWRVIAQHPRGSAGLAVRGVLVNFFDSDWDAMQEVSRIYPPIVELTVGVLPVIEFVLAIIGIIALWKTDRAMALLIGMTVAYFIVISAGAEAESRFRVPVIPQMAIAAAAGLAAVRRGHENIAVDTITPGCDAQ
jgi:hypothetical protein